MSGVPPRLNQSPVFATNEGAKEITLDQGLAHTFISAFACDANGDPLSNYSTLTGKFNVEVLSLNCPVFQKPQTNSINANAPVDISVAGNLLMVKVTPDNIVGATHFRVFTSQNLT